MMAEETEAERDERLRSSFWKALNDSPFMMLGLQGVEDSRTRPMTAQVDTADDDKGDSGTIYFFAAKSETLGQAIGTGHRAVAAYSSKDHKVFAHIHGTLVPDNDRSKIERLWNPFIASWYRDGKDDPDLLLLRFDTEHAEVWEAHSGSTLVAAALKMLGRDPGKDHQRKNQAEVAL
jgi:general stress protein 26